MKTLANTAFTLGLVMILLTNSNTIFADEETRVRSYTRTVEFDYVSWTAEALLLKLSQSTLGANRYLIPAMQHRLVMQYLTLIKQQQQDANQITTIYSDPSVSNPAADAAPIEDKLNQVNRQLDQIGPLAESILQAQVSDVVSSLGLSVGGQTLPPVLYHATSLPLALIVSPRSIIRQDQDISLVDRLSIDQITSIEDRVSKSLDVSALIVPVGGIGIYPTMVMETDDLNWLAEVIGHEWTHNFLVFRPLGLNYDASSELRTMNETAAAISGTEIGLQVITRFYPELLPHPSTVVESAPQKTSNNAPVFAFNAEMRQTRVEVDQLLSEGKIVQAEQYMNARRLVFWDHGYQIRKLNQAYFAFYGAYADQPGGAAGEDPVGPAVRALRSRSGSLGDFLNRISMMTSFSQLQQAIK